MWKVGLLVLYLLILSIYDCREKQVPTASLYAGIVAAVTIFLVELLAGQIALSQILGILPGTLLVCVAAVTRKAGMADGIVLAIMGIALGYQSAMLLLCISLMLFSVTSVLLMFARKVKMKTQIPYLPFLTVALLIQQII
ncbi:MAG: hypothetical protein E7291_10240 [Lachnospiraceae bacterium]|nr:hypothetical protein [Lachnospiraceae bacterium]